uniref:Uncharacterized protein n=1 Tax=Sinocyclocheilus anshuiensis TaxID=1608454 RepID=A0A671KDS9_9TELE
MDAQATSVLNRIIRRIPNRNIESLLKKWNCLSADQLRTDFMKSLAYVLTGEKKARNRIVIQDMVIVHCHPADFYIICKAVF